MDEFRFLHAADLHLDSPFEGLGRIDPARAERLRNASLDAWDQLVHHAVSAQVAFVVLAGDVYDGAERGLRAQFRLKSGMLELQKAGIQVFVASGNHDPEGARWGGLQQWPDNVVFFPTDRAHSHSLGSADSPYATVHGISYARQKTTENLALRFPRPQGPGFHLAVLHCNIGNNNGHAPYSPCSLSDLTGRGMHYWALGHIHRGEVLREDPWVVYPGNTQGRSFKASEQGTKGAVLVTVRGTQVVELTKVPTDSVRFLEADVFLDGIDDMDSVEERLRDRADRLAREHPGVLRLLRIQLRGATSVHSELRRGKEELLQTLLDTSDPESVWVDLLDHTTIPLDLDALKQRPDLSGEVYRDWSRLSPEALADLVERLDLPRVFHPPDQPENLLQDALSDILGRLEARP